MPNTREMRQLLWQKNPGFGQGSAPTGAIVGASHPPRPPCLPQRVSVGRKRWCWW